MDDFSLGVSFQACVLVLAGAQAVWSLHSVSDREGTGEPALLLGSQHQLWISNSICLLLSGYIPLLRDLHSFISYIHVYLLSVYSVHTTVLTSDERAETCRDTLNT